MPRFVGVLERPQIDFCGPPPELREQASQQVRLAVAAVGRDDELRLRGLRRPAAWRRAGVERGELADECIQRCIVEALHRERHLARFPDHVVFERVHLHARVGQSH